MIANLEWMALDAILDEARSDRLHDEQGAFLLLLNGSGPTPGGRSLTCPKPLPRRSRQFMRPGLQG